MDSKNWLQKLSALGRWVLRLIDVRLAVVMGASVFLLATNVEASDRYSAAVDLREGSLGTPDRAVSTQHQPSPAAFNSQLKSAGQSKGTEFDAAIAHRLSHSGLTRAAFSGNHLTRAHLFTDSSIQPH